MNAPLPSHALPEVTPRPLPAAMLEALAARFGDRLSTAAAVREQHGRDESPFPVTPPEAVVFAESTDDAAFVVRLAHAHAVPVIPFGVGSSLEGHLLAVQGGVSIDLSRMTRIVQVHPEDMTVTVEAGVTREQLNQHLRDQGLFFPIDPGANASLGGMAATRASGTNAVRYGTMRDNVLGLTVVTADGSVVRTGTRARKSSAGYDLTRVFVGSEGTLGVMTEVTLRLYPLPEAVSAAVCHFPTVDAAVQTTIQIIQLGVPIARCELLDVNAIRAVNFASKLGLRELPMLLMEFHGSDASVKEQAETVQALAADMGGEAFEWAHTPEERTRLWAARHQAYRAGHAPGLQERDHRRLRADLAPGRHHQRLGRRGRRVRAALLHRRPRRRRQLPHRLPGAGRRRGAARHGRAAEPADGAPRDRDGRHLHRRARHRAAQDGFPGRGGGRGRRRPDAPPQARAGPEEHHEPRQNLQLVTR